MLPVHLWVAEVEPAKWIIRKVDPEELAVESYLFNLTEALQEPEPLRQTGQTDKIQIRIIKQPQRT
ncbi:hypothetical protein D3C85_1717680 [compost metagenome]